MRHVSVLLLGYHPKTGENWSGTEGEEHSFTTAKLPWKQPDKNIIYAVNENETNLSVYDMRPTGRKEVINSKLGWWFSVWAKEVMGQREIMQREAVLDGGVPLSWGVGVGVPACVGRTWLNLRVKATTFGAELCFSFLFQPQLDSSWKHLGGGGGREKLVLCAEPHSVRFGRAS